MEQDKPQPLRILLVDDHPIVVEGLTRILDAHPDISVCGSAGSAAEARSKTLALEPDVIVLDLSLTDSSGVDLIKELSRVPRPSVVVYSQFGGQEMRRKSKASGAVAFVSKSASGDELAALLLSLRGAPAALPSAG
jgi:DNA-binding NarL/FixJ family response regulator